MKLKILLISTIITTSVFPQSFSLLSWNIQDLGKSKTQEEISKIIDIIKDFDLVLIQEVNAKDPTAEGAQTVKKIAEKLNQNDNNWGYSVSDATNSKSAYYMEKFAYLWKTSKLKLLTIPYLDEELEEICYKEPYLAEFQIKESSHSFWVINVHSRMPRNKSGYQTKKSKDSSNYVISLNWKKFEDKPEFEIKHFIDYPRRLKDDNIIIAGDFNLSEDNDVWIPLKGLGFTPATFNKPTSLKKECSKDGHYLNDSIDNIFYNSNIYGKVKSGSLDFVGECRNLISARKISDHLPVFIELNILKNNNK
jgi:deoxyribonuclease-1-like protein